MARHDMGEPFILINGDTVFEASVAAKLLQAPDAPITLAVDRKAAYDSDDMKVAVANGRLVDVSKRLDPGSVWGESIGMIRFNQEGADAFVAQIDAMIRTNTGLKSFYLAAIAELARRMHVSVAQITGSRWCEIDFPKDLAAALAMCTSWDTAAAAAG
jgi:choline kinase